MRLLPVLALFALAALGLTACGSSGSTHSSSSGSKARRSSPKAQVIAKGDAICRKYDKQSNQLFSSLKFNPAHASSAQLKKAAPLLAKQASILRTETGQVGALGAPDKDAALFQKTISGAKQAGQDFGDAAQAARRGDTKAFKTAFGKLDANNSSKLAKQFGFKTCGAS